MNLKRRIEQLERVHQVDDPVEILVMVTKYGCGVPGVCETTLVERDRKARPGERVRYIETVDGDGRCLACGVEHVDDQDPRGCVVKRLAPGLSMSDV